MGEPETLLTRHSFATPTRAAARLAPTPHKQHSAVASRAATKTKREHQKMSLPPGLAPPTKRARTNEVQCPYLDTINRHMLDFDFEKGESGVLYFLRGNNYKFKVICIDR